MPLLFSIGIQGALVEVASSMEVGEQLCVFFFFDDLYVFRVVLIFKLLS